MLSACENVNKYGFYTTAETVAKDYATNAKGKTILITGANTGLGFETAKQLAFVGARIVITCRSKEKVDESVAKLRALCPSAEIDGFPMELSSLQSVKACADAYLASGKPLNILINNAGVMACPKELSADGYESQFATNHLGHFLFTEKLYPLLKAAAQRKETARIVILSSMAHYVFPPRYGITLDDLEAAKGYDGWSRYGESKLANLLHAKQLAKRGDGVLAVSLHPGVIGQTDLGRHIGGVGLGGLWRYLINPKTLWTFATEGSKNIPQGSSTTVLCALLPDKDLKNGGYYANCRQETSGVHPLHDDATLAKKLWDKSIELVQKAGIELRKN